MENDGHFMLVSLCGFEHGGFSSLLKLALYRCNIFVIVIVNVIVIVIVNVIVIVIVIVIIVIVIIVIVIVIYDILQTFVGYNHVSTLNWTVVHL